MFYLAVFHKQQPLRIIYRFLLFFTLINSTSRYAPDPAKYSALLFYTRLLTTFDWWLSDTSSIGFQDRVWQIVGKFPFRIKDGVDRKCAGILIQSHLELEISNFCLQLELHFSRLLTDCSGPMVQHSLCGWGKVLYVPLSLCLGSCRVGFRIGGCLPDQELRYQARNN